MRRGGFFVLAVCSLTLVSVCNDALGARGWRSARRMRVNVGAQPCATAPAPATIRSPRLEGAVDGYTQCICAFWPYAYWGSYYSWYSIDYHPGCEAGYPVSMDGNFTVIEGDPCPTCPSGQCLYFEHEAMTPGRIFKKGTRLDKRLEWDTQLALKSGTGTFKTRSGAQRTFEFETRELADARMLVSFTSGNTQYFAKLHTCRVEAQELTGAKSSQVADFHVGQEINPPPADQKVVDVSAQVKIQGPNVASVKIGNATYQIVTATPLTE